MKGSILWKLLGINVAVLATAMLTVWFMIDILAANYFMDLMDRYNISPADSHQMFLDTVHRYLLQAAGIAVLLSISLSFLLTRKILKPLSRMTTTARGVAQGDFSVRLGLKSGDEVGELAQAFDRMSDSLERLERLRKTMVSDISHELRTPMTNIRGYLEGLADGVIEPSKETFELLEREILRLVDLVDDLGALAKAEGASLSLNIQVVSIEEAFDRLETLEAPKLEKYQLTLNTNVASGCQTVRVDPDRLTQILCNTLDNACRYAEQDSRLILEAKTPQSGNDNAIEISLTNSGPAIDERDLPFIFERFYRADPSRSRESGGAGVGLAIVKELVEAMGGQVGARCSVGLTSIWIRLPKG